MAKVREVVEDLRVGFRSLDVLELWSRVWTACGRPSVGAVGDHPTAQDVVRLPHPMYCHSLSGVLDAGQLRQLFRDEYLLKELVRKYPGFDLGVDRTRAALDGLRTSEVRNRSTNDRLRTYDPATPEIHQVLYLASRKIGRILGRFDGADDFAFACRLGPGSTTTLSRKYADNAVKLQDVPTVHRGALRLADLVLWGSPTWQKFARGFRGLAKGLCRRVAEGMSTERGVLSGIDFRVHDRDRWVSVPKNALTDRGITIPNGVSVYLQLGLGALMRRKLALAGVDLNDQSVNQRRAHLGSLTGEVATLDVKDASNSVTTGLVWNLIGRVSHDLLDSRWYALMDALRVPGCTLPDDSDHEYELFSAMGNGFTFELESLIFYGLAFGVCEYLGVPTDPVSVYGDDIVAPVGAVPLLTRVLAYAGFELNAAKSFSEDGRNGCGIFRESCGKHYLDGTDVTPFYVDKMLDEPEDLVVLANNIVRWAAFVSTSDGEQKLDARMQSVWVWVVSHLPNQYRRTRIPFGEENDGLILGWDLAVPRPVYSDYCNAGPIKDKLKTSPVGYAAIVLRHSFDSVEVTPEMAYLAKLYSASVWRPGVRGGKRFPGFPDAAMRAQRADYEIPSGSRMKTSVVHYRVVLSWPDPGPWQHFDGTTPVLEVPAILPVPRKWDSGIRLSRNGPAGASLVERLALNALPFAFPNVSDSAALKLHFRDFRLPRTSYRLPSFRYKVGGYRDLVSGSTS